MTCLECQKLQKKIRVMQTDFQFEFRKLSQDKSTQKALFEINIQKDVRKWQQKYTKQKIDHEENSKKWLQKIDQITLNCENRVEQLQAKWQSLLASSKQKTQRQILQFKQNTQAKQNSIIKRLVQKNESEMNSKQTYYKKIIQNLKESHSSEIDHIKKGHIDRQNKLRNEYQSLILGLKSEKNVDERNTIKILDEYRQQKSRLINQIYQLKYKISNSQQKIAELKRIIQQKDQTIIMRQKQIVTINFSHQQKIEELKSSYQRSLLQRQIKMEEKIKQFYENQLRITEKYEKSLSKIQQNRQVQLELYRHNMNQIKNCVENRLSRIEDVEEILHLKDRLFKKQKQCQAMQKQLKDFQLQLENKEDTYNKIFIPTINSTHLPGQNVIKRKQLKIKRNAGKSVTTVRQILNSININSSNLPLLNNIDKKMLLPPKSTKIL